MVILKSRKANSLKLFLLCDLLFIIYAVKILGSSDRFSRDSLSGNRPLDNLLVEDLHIVINAYQTHSTPSLLKDQKELDPVGRTFWLLIAGESTSEIVQILNGGQHTHKKNVEMYELKSHVELINGLFGVSSICTKRKHGYSEIRKDTIAEDYLRTNLYMQVIISNLIARAIFTVLQINPIIDEISVERYIINKLKHADVVYNLLSEPKHSPEEKDHRRTVYDMLNSSCCKRTRKAFERLSLFKLTMYIDNYLDISSRYDESVFCDYILKSELNENDPFKGHSISNSRENIYRRAGEGYFFMWNNSLERTKPATAQNDNPNELTVKKPRTPQQSNPEIIQKGQPKIFKRLSNESHSYLIPKSDEHRIKSSAVNPVSTTTVSDQDRQSNIYDEIVDFDPNDGLILPQRKPKQSKFKKFMRIFSLGSSSQSVNEGALLKKKYNERTTKCPSAFKTDKTFNQCPNTSIERQGLISQDSLKTRHITDYNDNSLKSLKKRRAMQRANSFALNDNEENRFLLSFHKSTCPEMSKSTTVLPCADSSMRLYPESTEILKSPPRPPKSSHSPALSVRSQGAISSYSHSDRFSKSSSPGYSRYTITPTEKLSPCANLPEYKHTCPNRPIKMYPNIYSISSILSDGIEENSSTETLKPERFEEVDSSDHKIVKEKKETHNYLSKNMEEIPLIDNTPSEFKTEPKFNWERPNRTSTRIKRSSNTSRPLLIPEPLSENTFSNYQTNIQTRRACRVHGS